MNSRVIDSIGIALVGYSVDALNLFNVYSQYQQKNISAEGFEAFQYASLVPFVIVSLPLLNYALQNVRNKFRERNLFKLRTQI